MRAQSPRNLNLGTGYKQCLSMPMKSLLLERERCPFAACAHPRDLKTFGHPLGFRRTQALNDHVRGKYVTLCCHCNRLDHLIRMRQIPSLLLRTLISQQKVAPGQYSALKSCNIVVSYLSKLTETFQYRMSRDYA
jgi:hypothetical protein